MLKYIVRFAQASEHIRPDLIRLFSLSVSRMVVVGGRAGREYSISNFGHVSTYRQLLTIIILTFGQFRQVLKFSRCKYGIVFRLSFRK